MSCQATTGQVWLSLQDPELTSVSAMVRSVVVVVSISVLEHCVTVSLCYVHMLYGGTWPGHDVSSSPVGYQLSGQSGMLECRAASGSDNGRWWLYWWWLDWSWSCCLPGRDLNTPASPPDLETWLEHRTTILWQISPGQHRHTDNWLGNWLHHLGI